MTHKNVRICNCGDCDAAIDRAIAIVKGMMVDNECCVFQTAVAAAMGPVVIETFNITTVDLLRTAGIPMKMAVAISAERIEQDLDGIETKVVDRMHERRDEMVGTMVEAYLAQRKRAVADREARRTDSAEIKGGPKPT